MNRVIAEIKFSIPVTDEELAYYKELGLAALFDKLNLLASEYDEILFEDTEEN